MKQGLRCVDARNIDLVSYLETLGFSPQKVRGQDYWYCSPLRNEKTPSFKVDRNKNLWYDHGIGKGGNLVDFGVLFYGCSIRELLQKLSGNGTLLFSFHPPVSPEKAALEGDQGRLQITTVQPLSNPHLFHYLDLRGIGHALAKQYLEEVTFALNGRSYTSLGFQNNRGGFELRSRYFKGSSAPKDVTFFDHKGDAVCVFEGCFSFLSYLSLMENQGAATGVPQPEKGVNYLVLNSLSFLEKSRGLMERYPSVHLYLDCDAAGLNATQQALQWSPKYKDKSAFYKGYKDLNDFLVHQLKTGKTQGRRRGLHL
ncbi:Toprim-like [Cnuella takakiae]|uniref:Toprim-like n=1 Tax=Cnuella takakiae TaxID=1302690 RepID=A0A1M5CFH9_9BACT|nr:toprim domain-containing protein [Cnuella takakiae]OLY91806.1 hypothetical protein BUE76_07755 [Cnuella takakiae]SHF53524.1 Toprim-like [Cnuella takakiae]